LGPFSGGERRTVKPQRTDALSANLGRRSRTFRAGCAEGDDAAALSFGYFSLGKQRKVTGPQGCGTNHARTRVGFRDEAKRQNNTIPTQPSP
jgi:hypothetical protein